MVWKHCDFASSSNEVPNYAARVIPKKKGVKKLSNDLLKKWLKMRVLELLF